MLVSIKESQPFNFGALLLVMLLFVLQVNDKWLYLVVNAGCRDKDLEWIEGHLAKEKVRATWSPCVGSSKKF